MLLDEPTNHLDIESREWIEDAVANFVGTMLFISHDRYFLGKFASRVWSMKDGAVADFHGGFGDYLQSTVEAKQPAEVQAQKKKKKTQVKTKKKAATES